MSSTLDFHLDLGQRGVPAGPRHCRHQGNAPVLLLEKNELLSNHADGYALRVLCRGQYDAHQPVSLHNHVDMFS